MKTLFFHIGTQKTATKSIQETLFTFREKLIENDFFLFSEDSKGIVSNTGKAMSWYRPCQDDLYGFSMKIYAPQILAERLNSAPCSNVIMSSERFSLIYDKEDITNLYKELSKYFSIKIIIYIRRQDLYALSIFQQLSKSYTDIEYGSFLQSTTALPQQRDEYKDFFNHDAVVSTWSDVFGIENVVIRVFESERFVGGNPITDFLYVLGLTDFKVKNIHNNISNSFEEVKIGHLMNYSGLNGKIRSIINEALDKRKKSLPSRTAAIAFYEQYIESNIKLNKKFNISDEFEDIFSDDFSKYPEERCDLWNEETANEAFMKIFKAMGFLNQLDVTLFKNKNFFAQVKNEKVCNILCDQASKIVEENKESALALLQIAALFNPENMELRERIQSIINFSLATKKA